MFILIVVLVFLGPAPTVSYTKQGYTALSFGRSAFAYVQFQPGDMSAFASSFTLCAWIKRWRMGHFPIVLHYYPGPGIVLGSNGYHNWVGSVGLDLRGKFPEDNVWFHHCLSWAAGGTQIVYINGVQLASKPASSGNLRLGGTICLGNRGQSTKMGNMMFNGKLYKLNMFSEQLTSSQIKEMTNSGMCSAVEEKYETRLLKWEQIIAKQRHGNVTDFLLGECAMLDINYVKTKLNQTENELTLTKKTLQNTKTALNSTESDLHEVSTRLHNTLSELNETQIQLNETRTELLEEKQAKLHEPAQTVSYTKQGYTALRFGRSAFDYVQFQPGDMSPFASSFTLCSWMKRAHRGHYPIVLHYNQSDDILVGMNGYFNYVTGVHLDLKGKFPEDNVWFHYCLSWAAGGTQRVYINGVELGSTSASSRHLRSGGDICLGNMARSIKYGTDILRGKLYKLNMFSEQLTSSQIREMAQNGMCSAVEEKYETRLLKWEQIIAKQRHGNVTDFLLGECAMLDINYVKTKLNQTENELRLTKTTLQNTKTTLNSTESDIHEVSTRLQNTLSELNETQIQLNETRTELEEKQARLHETEANLEEKDTELQESQNEILKKENRLQETETECNSTKHELQKVSITLNSTSSELAETRTQLNDTRTELHEKEANLEEKDTELQESKIEILKKENRLQETAIECNRTKHELQEVSITLNSTSSELAETRIELNVTRTELHEMEVNLEEKDTELQESKNEILKKENRLQETVTECNRTKHELQEVSITLNGTLSELAEKGFELNETRTELHEKEASLEEKDTELQETQNEILKKEKWLQETETECNRTMHELQEVSITLNGTLSELAETKTQLNESQTELEEKETMVNQTETELRPKESRLMEPKTKCMHKLIKAEIELKLTRKNLRNTNRRLNRDVERCERKYVSLLEHFTEYYEE